MAWAAPSEEILNAMTRVSRVSTAPTCTAAEEPAEVTRVRPLGTARSARRRRCLITPADLWGR